MPPPERVSSAFPGCEACVSKPVLVGDVGGTKVRLGLATSSLGHISLDDVRVYSDPSIPSLSDAVDLYLKETGERPSSALFALAGPISEDGSIRLTNRDWPQVVPEEIRSRFGMRSTRIVNDFAAMARAIPEIPKSDFETVIESRNAPGGPILVTGPGTGMGVSTLIRSVTGGWRVMTGEGGHASFAPHNTREAAIRDIIGRGHPHVSVEMIVSGRWLMPVYRAICELKGTAPEDLSPQDMLDRADEGEAICLEVCTFRANALMGAVGDAALITGANAGVVLTGGVAERMVKWVRQPDAIKRFHERGPMSPFLAHTPVSVLMHDEAPLIGAAALAIEIDNV